MSWDSSCDRACSLTGAIEEFLGRLPSHCPQRELLRWTLWSAVWLLYKSRQLCAHTCRLWLILWLLGLLHCISFFPYGFFYLLSLLCTSLPTTVPLPMLEKGGIHDSGTRMSCECDTVLDGSDSTVMLKRVELSLFYSTAEILTSIFKRLILFRFTEVSQCLLLAVAFSCQSTYISVLTTIFLLGTVKEFYKNNALVSDAQSI